MATIHLQVAGWGYDGAPAGRGGDQFDADLSGNESDKVYYRVHSGGGITGAAKLFFRHGRDDTGSNHYVGVAYLSREHRDSLTSAGVNIDEHSVRLGGGANYYLWDHAG